MNNKNTHSGRIRAAFEAVAIIFFIWFLLPLADGEANIGSITGMSVFLLLFLYVLFLGPAGRALQRLKSSVSGRILVYALTVLLLVIVLLTVILTICMVMPVFGSHDGDILIIMGCRIDGRSGEYAHGEDRNSV